jgi:hypothetical protein
MMKYVAYILLLIHIILLAWAVGGFLEMCLPDVPWQPFTNPEFPFWVLLIHWGSVLFASGIFIYGYLARWRRTPTMMLVGYSLMALVCIIETFGFMTSLWKYHAMGAEFLTYAVILWMLFRGSYFKGFFAGR